MSNLVFCLTLGSAAAADVSPTNVAVTPTIVSSYAYPSSIQDGNIPYTPAEGKFLNYNPITGDWGVLYEVCNGDEGQWRASDDGCDFDMQTGNQKEPTGIGLIPYPSTEASILLAEHNG